MGFKNREKPTLHRVKAQSKKPKIICKPYVKDKMTTLNLKGQQQKQTLKFNHQVMPGIGIQRHFSLCLLLNQEYCHVGRSVRFDLNSAEQPGAAADCFTELHRGDCGSSNKRR